MPSVPPASASAGSARYSAGSARMLVVGDVGRVAEDQVVAAAAAPRTGRTRRPRMRSSSPCRATLMRASASASARDVGGVDLDLRIGHRRDHRQAAVAGAQVEHAPGAVGEPGVERAGLLAVGQQLGDVGARHDRALVDRERHVLQPGLAGEVGGGLAGLDAPRDQRLGLGDCRPASTSRWPRVSSASSGRPSAQVTSQAASSKALPVPWPNETPARFRRSLCAMTSSTRVMRTSRSRAPR